MVLSLAEILAMCIVATLWNIFLFVIMVRGKAPAPKKKGEPLAICFVHPDLGLGGAEMLVVETASALVKQGHHVEVFTSFHDPKRAFTETIDGTLDVHVHDSIIPRSIWGRFINPLASIRFFWTSAKVMMRHKNLAGGYDVIFVDQISTTIPLLKYSGAKVLYYCHFPDLLLASHSNLLKRLYRAPIDFLEEITTAQADVVLVNSNFTAEVYKRTFKRIHKAPVVLYPTVHAERISSGSHNKFLSTPSASNSGSLERTSSSSGSRAQSLAPRSPTASPKKVTRSNSREKPANASTGPSDEIATSSTSSPDSTTSNTSSNLLTNSKGLIIVPEKLAELGGTRFILSLNRYERKKNHNLAIDAAKLVLDQMDAKEKEKFRLVIAGGYDERVAENVQHFVELQEHAKQIGVSDYVKFYIKLPDLERNWLLWNSKVVLYTPENEHFGIVPLEAGVALRPVIACNSGGPLESIVDGVTGYHLPPDPALWADKVLLLLRNDTLAKSLGESAVKRVIANFSPNAILPKLESILYDLSASYY